MKQASFPPFLTILLAFIVMFSSSCSTYSSLRQPLTENITTSLKNGDKVKLILTNGVTTESMTIEHVWQDSIKMVNDARAIPIANISQIHKRKVDPALTAVVLVFPLAILVIIGVRTSENVFSSGWKI